MNNKEWLSQLNSEQFYAAIYWLITRYSMQFTNSQLGVVAWLDADFNKDLFEQSQSGTFCSYYYPKLP